MLCVVCLYLIRIHVAGFCTWSCLFLLRQEELSIWSLKIAGAMQDIFVEVWLDGAPVVFSISVAVGFFHTELPQKSLVNQQMELWHVLCIFCGAVWVSEGGTKCWKPSILVQQQGSTRLWTNGPAFMNWIWITAVLVQPQTEDGITYGFRWKCHRFLLHYCKHNLLSHWP